MVQPKVFLSHSSKDAAFTDRLEADLKAAGATVFRVSARDSGDFVKRINDALAACDYVVLVLTKDALASDWVESEMNAAIRLARQGRIKSILPVQAGPVDTRGIPPLWGVYNIFDATRDYVQALASVQKELALNPPEANTVPDVSTARDEAEYRRTVSIITEKMNEIMREFRVRKRSACEMTGEHLKKRANRGCPLAPRAPAI